MLNINILLYIPFSGMAVILFVLGMSSIVQSLVFNFLFTHITEHIWSLLCSLLLRNTSLKMAGVQITLNIVHSMWFLD